MPSPIGHTLAGLCGFTLVHRQVAVRHRFPLMFVSVLIANLPDVDLLFGLFLRGNLGVFHRQATHSLIVAAGVGMIVAFLVKRWQLKCNIKAWSLWVAGLYASHIFLDMLGKDGHYPYGLQALWPLSQRYFISPITFFTPLNIHDILSFANVAGGMREIYLLVPLLWLSWHWSKQLSGRVNFNRSRQTYRHF